GTASASVKSVLEDRGQATHVNVLTTLNVTGKPAQFGRGVMNEVGGRLLTIFASNLAALLAEQEGAPEAASPAAAGPAAASSEAAGPEAAGSEGAAASAVDKPIDDLKLPPRAASSLLREGITTVGQLATKTEAELLAIDGIGPASVEEIKAKLTGLGLTPGQPLPVAAAAPAEAAPTPAAPAPAAPTPAARTAVGPSAAVTQASDGATAPAAAAVAPQHPSTTREFVHKAEDDAINLLRVAGVPVLKRAIPVLAGVVAALLIGLRRKAARRRAR